MRAPPLPEYFNYTPRQQHAGVPLTQQSPTAPTPLILHCYNVHVWARDWIELTLVLWWIFSISPVPLNNLKSKQWAVLLPPSEQSAAWTSAGGIWLAGLALISLTRPWGHPGLSAGGRIYSDLSFLPSPVLRLSPSPSLSPSGVDEVRDHITGVWPPVSLILPLCLAHTQLYNSMPIVPPLSLYHKLAGTNIKKAKQAAFEPLIWFLPLWECCNLPGI